MTVTVILSVLAIMSAGLYLRARYRSDQRRIYIFKPLTTTIILLIALCGAEPVSTSYKWAVVVGLIFSLGGDIFLMLPQNRFILGLASFLLAHVTFTLAFSSVEGFYSSPLVLAPLLFAGVLVLFGLLWPNLGRMRLPAALYTLVILVMAWQAAGYQVQVGNTSSLMALIGSLLFVFSDMILTINRFRSPIPNASLIYMPAYYAAIWLIALSVGI